MTVEIYILVAVLTLAITAAAYFGGSSTKKKEYGIEQGKLLQKVENIEKGQDRLEVKIEGHMKNLKDESRKHSNALSEEINRERLERIEADKRLNSRIDDLSRKAGSQ